MSKKTTSDAAYVRAPRYAELLSGVQFPPEVWAVFAQCDAPRRPADIARRARLGEAEVAAALRRLSRRRLVQKHELDWHAYLAGATEPAQAAAPAAPPEPPAPPARPEPAPAPAPTLPAPTPPDLLCFTLGNAAAEDARRRRARDVLSLSLGRAQPAGDALAA